MVPVIGDSTSFAFALDIPSSLHLLSRGRVLQIQLWLHD